MQRKVISDSSDRTVHVSQIFNSDTVGFISSDGQVKGFIARVEYDEYKPVTLDSVKYYSPRGDKEQICKALLDIGCTVIQFSSDAELKPWLLK